MTFYAFEQNRPSSNRLYQEVKTSPTFPLIRQTTLQRFIQRCYQDGELQAEDLFRDWVRQKVQLLKTAGVQTIQEDDLFT